MHLELEVKKKEIKREEGKESIAQHKKKSKGRAKLKKPKPFASEALDYTTHFAMAVVAQTPDIAGERQSGQDVRTQNGIVSLSLFSFTMKNVTTISNIVQSLLMQLWHAKPLPTSSKALQAPLASTRYSLSLPLPLSIQLDLRRSKQCLMRFVSDARRRHWRRHYHQRRCHDSQDA